MAKHFFKKLSLDPKIHLFSIIILFLFGLFCSKGLFKYYGFSTHDGDYHIARVFDAIQAIKEGYFPLRWAGSLNYLCGVPVYNFFYPLIYYLAVGLYYLAGDVVVSLKILALSSFIIGPIFFYLWLYQETKNRSASFLGGFLYLFLPYRFLLVYVRFSPEFLSYTLLPILLFLVSRLFVLLKKDNEISPRVWRASFLVAVLMSLLLISHNFSVILLFPLVLLFIFAKMWENKFLSKKKIGFFLLLIFSSLFLVSFFLGPMILEKKFVRLGSENVVNCLDHFPTIYQTVRSRWGYGGSMPGTAGDLMSFSLGYSQWLVLIIAAIYLITLFLKRSKNINFQVIFWFLLSLISLFFILPPSSFIWRSSKILCDLQFPWRFLGVCGFTTAALGAFLLKEVKNRVVFYCVFFGLVLLGFWGNRNHLLAQPVLYPNQYLDFENAHPARFAPTMVNDDILNKESKTACSFDEEFAVRLPNQKLDYSVYRKNNSGEVVINNKTENLENTEGAETESISLRLNLEFFPDIYKITLNGQNFDKLENCGGRLCLREVFLIPGRNVISWKIIQSPIEKFFNFVSLATLGFWVGGLAIASVTVKKGQKKK